MKKSILALSLATILFSGCSSTSNDSNNQDLGTVPTSVTDAIKAPKSTLTQDLQDSITYMYSEERLAYDVYINIYQKRALKQLTNIATNAETKHIEKVDELAVKYDLNITRYPDTNTPYSTDDLKRYGSGQYPVTPIQDLYNLLYDKGIQSDKDALEVGCMVEVVDIDDLDKYIKQAKTSNASDVITIFEFLRDGSYKHYWSFDKGLKNIGISNGCCSISDYDGHNFCHPEYPNN